MFIPESKLPQLIRDLGHEPVYLGNGIWGCRNCTLKWVEGAHAAKV